MAQAELVRREPCPDDRRGSYAVLTEKGDAVLRQASPGHLRGIAAHFARQLRDAELATLQGFFDRVLLAEENRSPDTEADYCSEAEDSAPEPVEDADGAARPGRWRRPAATRRL